MQARDVHVGQAESQALGTAERRGDIDSPHQPFGRMMRPAKHDVSDLVRQCAAERARHDFVLQRLRPERRMQSTDRHAGREVDDRIEYTVIA